MKSLILFVKGLIIGTTGIIPGVSGSIFAVILGVYDKMIEAARGIKKHFKKSAFFLLPILLGVVLGVVLMAKPVEIVCEKFPLYSYSFFIGIMIASFLPAAKKIKGLGRPKIGEIAVAVLAVAFVLILRAIVNMQPSEDFITIPSMRNAWDFLTMLFAGFLSVGMMTLPGVSGTVTLMVIGQYGSLTNAAGSPIDLLMALFSGNFEEFGKIFATTVLLLPFAIGAILGFALVAKLMSYLLKTQLRGVYCAVSGFITASCITLVLDGIVPNIKVTGNSDFLTYFITIICAIAGFLLTLAFSADKKKD